MIDLTDPRQCARLDPGGTNSPAALGILLALAQQGPHNLGGRCLGLLVPERCACGGRQVTNGLRLLCVTCDRVTADTWQPDPLPGVWRQAALFGATV